MQLAPNSTAWRTPVQRAAGCGGRHRSSPTGGAANGIPLYDTTRSANTPWSSPVSTWTIAGACESTVVGTLVAAANVASDPNRSLLILFAGLVIIGM
jgi:hypothetical protein